MPVLPDTSFTDIMTYQEAIDYLFNKTLVFQHIGAQAYKPGLETALQLSELFGNPQNDYKTIHVAGTNGKGSTSHLLAAILQKSGYKVGLFTSPHLIDFRERIRVNGKMIEENEVIDFLQRFLSSGYSGRQPSFFELTTIIAFDYFSRQNVDIAVIEVGLGGRLDSTNILTPLLSVITNISFDHTQFLGNTLAEIASEKAGIIKPSIPVVIGETVEETRPVFSKRAESQNAPIIFAEDCPELLKAIHLNDKLEIESKSFGTLSGELSGECQNKNANTVLCAVKQLQQLGLNIPTSAIAEGFANVCQLTGLMGRWMKISDTPRTFCDTGHNTGGFQYIIRQLSESSYSRLHIIIGFVSDKDVHSILGMLPKDAVYYFTQASVPRALNSNKLKELAEECGLNGTAYPTVASAYEATQKESAPTDMIYIGGSTFIVADLLSAISDKR